MIALINDKFNYVKDKIPDGMVFYKEDMSFDGDIIAVLSKERHGNSIARKVVLDVFHLSTGKRIYHRFINVDRNIENYNLSVSPNGRYIACIVDKHLIVFDCSVNKKVMEKLSGPYEDTTMFRVMDNGHLIMVINAMFVALMDPFQQKEEMTLVHITRLSEVNVESNNNIRNINIIDLIYSLDGKTIAILCGYKGYDRGFEKSESEIFLYNTKIGRTGELTKENDIVKKQEKKENKVLNDIIDWSYEEGIPIRSLNDQFCKSFCFIPESNLGLAWYHGEYYSDLITYNLLDGSVVSGKSLPYINVGYGRVFKFVKMLTATESSVFFRGYSKASTYNPYNNIKDNEYQNHIIEINLTSGKEIGRKDFDYSIYANLAKNCKKIISINNSLNEISFKEFE
ncbi:hypothetical protein [Bacillus benzoevorans]|uniref:Uncharacterized protein n=1 Tax=Bacillus benzoevorans TaxID=1456 RepID=A0A7X0HSP9_9BACI|nr:hypothetical protein [Bacillus benzoevorans]MBB6446137.1 hypothetical protein [Bacillus benzoevorans]